MSVVVAEAEEETEDHDDYSQVTICSKFRELAV